MTNSWTEGEAASVWDLLQSFTNPDPQVQTNTLSQISHLNQTWMPLPYLLAEFLAHGNPAAAPDNQSNGQKAAGTCLKQLLTERVQSQKATGSGQPCHVGPFPLLNIEAFDVPLLFAICSGDKQIQMVASTCLSQLVQYATELANASNWIAALITKLEQLVQANNVTNNVLGVSRCLGVLMEDRNQQLLAEARATASNSGDTEEQASQALVQRLASLTQFVVPVYRLLTYLLTQSQSLPAKLNALSCIAGITFVLGESSLHDSDDEGGESLQIKGRSPNKVHVQQDAKAARAEFGRQMLAAEKGLVATVVASLPSIVAEAQQGCDVSNTEGLNAVLDSFTVALKALMSVAAHWEATQRLALAVLPTVLQWLAVFDWRQQAAGVAAIGVMRIDPSLLRNSSFEAEGLRVSCLEFISDIAHQIEDSDEVSSALESHHVAILEQLYAAFVLDQAAVVEVCIGDDRHVPDEMQDVMFTGRNKNKNADEGEEDELLDDGHEDDAGPHRCTSPTRNAAMFCFNAIAFILPPAFVFAVMDMLHPVVQKHIAADGRLEDWLELEGALAFLAEALSNGISTGDDDDHQNMNRMSAVAEEVAVICCRFLGAVQSADGSGFTNATPHFAGPVRAASARILSRIAERLLYDSSPDDIEDVTPAILAQLAAKAQHQNSILEGILQVLYNTIVHDTNKSALCAAIGSFGAILQHNFVAQMDDEDGDELDDDEDQNGGGEAGTSTAHNGGAQEIPCVSANEHHVRNFYGLASLLTNMPLTQRVCFYKLLPTICETEIKARGRSAIYLQTIEPLFLAILAAWKGLVTQLDTYESLAIGDLVYELLNQLTKDDPSKTLPVTVAKVLWHDIGVVVFQSSGLAQNFLNGVDHSGLTTETVSMAVDVLSGICDSTDTATSAALFHDTGLASAIAGIVLPNLTNHTSAANTSTSVEEFIRASLGLLGDFCSIVSHQEVMSVADQIVAPIAQVLVSEAAKVRDSNLTTDGTSVTKTFAGGLKVTSLGGAELSDLLSGLGGDSDGKSERVMLGNSLYCLAKLLEKIQSADELLRVCPKALPSPQALQDLLGACTTLLRFIGGAASEVTKLNLLVVCSKMGAMFPAVLDSVGGDSVIINTGRAIATVEDMFEQLDVAASIAAYFYASDAVKASAANDIHSKGLILSIALAIASTLKKCMTAARKGSNDISPTLIDKAQKVHGLWQPIVSMCSDAINTAPSAKFSTAMKTTEKKLLQQVFA